MASALFSFETPANTLLTELAELDGVGKTEVLRRSLMLYHFLRREMRDQGLQSGAKVGFEVGNKKIDVVIP